MENGGQWRMVVSSKIETRPLTLKILSSSSISPVPGNMGFLVRISPKMQPTLHMSIAVE